MQLIFNVASHAWQLFHYYFVYLISQQFCSNDTFYGCSSFHIVIVVVLIQAHAKCTHGHYYHTVHCNCCHIDVWTDDKNITNGLGFRAAAILQTCFSIPLWLPPPLPLPLPLPLSPSSLWHPTLQHSGAISVWSSHIFNTIFDACRGDHGSNDFNLWQGCKSQRKKGNGNMARGTAECVASIGKCSIRSRLIQLMSFRTVLELWWRMYPMDSKFLLCSWPSTVASRIQWRASRSGPSGHNYCNALQRVWPTTLDAPTVTTFPT